jgi:hypothetical protein
LPNGRAKSLCLEWAREEVCESQDTVVMQISGLENVVAGQILLFGGDLEARRRTDVEMTALVLVQYAAENRW